METSPGTVLCYKLQEEQSATFFCILQVLDSSNHLVSALNILDTPPLRFNDNIRKFDFKTVEEVVEVFYIGNIDLRLTAFYAPTASSSTM